MAYTNVWTTAAPLDTQAANQGAVDFRATKLDVMQRIASFGAGVLASRPTPEATSVTADWTGVMYWATDTKQTFRWNGSAWVDITTSIPTGSLLKFLNTTPVTFTDDGSPHNGQTIVLATNALIAGSVLKMKARMTVTSAQVTPFSKMALQFGASLVAECRTDSLAPGVLSNNNAIDFEALLVVRTTTQELGYGKSQLALFTAGSGNPIYGLGSNPVEDTTTSITIKTVSEGGINSGGTIFCDYLEAEILV